MNLEIIKKQTVSMILKFSIPSIIAMVLSSLITIADGYFIGNQIGEKGISAINLGLPILYLFLGFGIMIGVGGVSIAIRLLGGRYFKEFNNVFNQTVITSLAGAVFLSIVMFFLLSILLPNLGLDNQLKNYIKDYYHIMLITYPIMMMNIVFGMFIRGEGKPQVFMIVNIISIVINILLDYLFIIKLELGIAGAAYASLIAVVLGSLLMILYFYKISENLKFKKVVFEKAILKDTVLNGSSELIGQLALGISMMAYNVVIMKIAGVSGVAAFTIIGYTAYISSMVIIGFGQGASPLISFCFGAKELELCQYIRKITNIFVLVFGILAFLIMQISADSYATLFVKELKVQELIISGIKIFTFSFILSGINVITSFYFTSIGKAKESAMISASRGLIVILICILVLPILFGMTGIWLAAPVTEGVTVVLSLFLINKERSNDAMFLSK